MAASPGAPDRLLPGLPPPGRRPRKAGWGTTAGAVVVLSALVAAAAVGGCEYTYDDDRGWGGAAATPAPGPAFTRNPPLEPVPASELKAWVSEVLPATVPPALHVYAGLLAARQAATGTTPELLPGSYVLSLACRSAERVNFTVRSDTLALVDLGLRCGITRENVVYLPEATALEVRVEAAAPANYAYRVRRLEGGALEKSDCAAGGAAEGLRAGRTLGAIEGQSPAAGVGAVLELAGGRGASGALADGLGLVAELQVHAFVEDVEGAFPEPLVLERFAIADDTAVQLVDLLEPAVHHEAGEHLAADTACAIGNDRLVL